MRARTIAIGDVHGHAIALRAVLEAIAPGPDDTIVALGDYVDRGPDSRAALDLLIELADSTRLIPLLGNHDQLFRDVCLGKNALLYDWLQFGGHATVASYGGRVPEAVPVDHINFLRSCRLWYETDTHLFVHATYRPELPLERQPEDALLWEKLRDEKPGPHHSGKRAIVGHTAQKDGQILNLGYLVCIDTCCYCDGGWLTAMDVDTGRVWQADKEGRLRY